MPRLKPCQLSLEALRCLQRVSQAAPDAVPAVAVKNLDTAAANLLAHVSKNCTKGNADHIALLPEGVLGCLLLWHCWPHHRVWHQYWALNIDWAIIVVFVMIALAGLDRIRELSRQEFDKSLQLPCLDHVPVSMLRCTSSSRRPAGSLLARPSYSSACAALTSMHCNGTARVSHDKVWYNTRNQHV
jgi:hypothetical protein